MDWTYITPSSLSEAVGAITAGDARILAGGTDFYPSAGSGPIRGNVVDLSNVADMNGIVRTHSTVRIGAGVTWTAIVKAELPPCFDGLKAAAREIGSRQIQNRGTIGGNLCNASPAADGVPPLLALDAEVELAMLHGQRRMPLRDFVLGNRRTALQPGELMTSLIVPLPVAPAASVFNKLGSRKYLVISIAMVAVNLTADDRGAIAEARIAVGACSPVAHRLYQLEALLKGQSLAPGLGGLVRPQHVAELTPIDDLRASASYRKDAAVVLVKRTLEDCATLLQP